MAAMHLADIAECPDVWLSALSGPGASYGAEQCAVAEMLMASPVEDLRRHDRIVRDLIGVLDGELQIALARHPDRSFRRWLNTPVAAVLVAA